MIQENKTLDFRVHDFVQINDLRGYVHLAETIGKFNVTYTPESNDPKWRLVHIVDHFGVGTCYSKMSRRHEQPPVILDLNYVTLLKRPPIVEGARVRLVKTPTIDADHSPGWLGCEHFLVAGAQATVKDVECGGAYLAFDDDSYVSIHTKEVIPRLNKGHFWFSWEWFGVVV